MSSFIDQYLPVLTFPSDVTGALSSGKINLQEAPQLARITPERLACRPAEALARRGETLRGHLAV